MNIEQVRKYCLNKTGVTEEFPFGDDIFVFKVMSKMFCLMMLNNPPSINLKCDPEFAVELREKYESVQPGYHMNKTHWNTILLDGSIPKKEILKWIDLSYDLVIKGLSKKEQRQL